MNFLSKSYLDEDFILFAKDKEGRQNGMTCGWATEGIFFRKHVIMLFVRKSRFTYDFLEKSDNFVIATVDDREILRYFGSVSGRDEDKMKKYGFNLVENEDSSLSIEGVRDYLNLKKLLSCDLKHASFIDEEMKKKYREDEDPHVVYICEVL